MHFSAKALLVLLMSEFFAKNQCFFGKNSTFAQGNSVSCVGDILVLFSVFVRFKVTVNENISFMDYAFKIKLIQIGHKLEKWR